MDYFSYVTRVANEANLMRADIDLPLLVPAAIDYAEQRSYRDLNLLHSVVRDTSVTTVANLRSVTLPISVTNSTQGFQTITGVNVITPASAAASSAGTRNALSRSWQGLIDYLYPSDTSSAATVIPTVYAVIGSTYISPTPSALLLGPSPGSSYILEITGTVRPTALSSANTTSVLTLMYPDLFMAASMVYISNYVMNLNPADQMVAQLAQTWETQYQSLALTAKSEQERARFDERLNRPPPAIVGRIPPPNTGI